MATVVVTGASGFIALHCIQQLLAAGHTVRGTLRTISRAAEVSAAVGEPEGDRLSFVYADLTGDEGWAEACAGADYALHIASPLPVDEPEHEADLIIPARDGALRLLRAAKDAGVTRVVLTSSTAAISGGEMKPEGEPYTEADWTDTEHPSVLAYAKSKTLAERAAWEFVAAEDGPELAVINPGVVLGPMLSADGSASGEIVRLMLTGKIPACPRLAFGCVDVRDVAAAHVAAMTAPDAAGQRHLCSSDLVWMIDIARALRANGYKAPRFQVPDFISRLVAPHVPALKGVRHMIGRKGSYDNSRLTETLGIQLRSLEEMSVAMAASMTELGVLTET